MESCVGPADGVFGKGAAWSHHFVEGGDAVARFEFIDVGADGVDDAGNVVAGVGIVVWDYFGNFPGGLLGNAYMENILR
jgi:hypothetical protein